MCNYVRHKKMHCTLHFDYFQRMHEQWMNERTGHWYESLSSSVNYVVKRKTGPHTHTQSAWCTYREGPPGSVPSMAGVLRVCIAAQGDYFEWDGDQISFCFSEVWSNKVQILCYCSCVDFPDICTFLEYLLFWQHFTFSLYIWTQYLYFLLLTFSKQACYFSFNAFVFLAVLRALYQTKMSLFVVFSGAVGNSSDKSSWFYH